MAVSLPTNLTLEASFPLGLAEVLREAAQSQVLPPVEHWNPAHCGDSLMHIARDGRWYHREAPIARPALARLFSTLLRKEADGFVLVTPAEKLSIAVEDAPFMAQLLEVEGKGKRQRLLFTTNMGDVAVAGPQHDLRLKCGIPYLDVRRGLEARPARAVYYQLVDRAVEKNGRLGVWSDGVFFPLEAP